MSAKSNMQMLNLGLSIFNKLQMIQQRSVKMSLDMAKKQNAERQQVQNRSGELPKLTPAIDHTI